MPAVRKTLLTVLVIIHLGRNMVSIVVPSSVKPVFHELAPKTQ